MKDYQQTVSEDRRLLILRALSNSNGYKASILLLKSFLQSCGHNVSGDVVGTELYWLAEQGLLRVDHQGEVGTAKLLTRGLNVANGESQVPGVRRPLPGEA